MEAPLGNIRPTRLTGCWRRFTVGSGVMMSGGSKNCCASERLRWTVVAACTSESTCEEPECCPGRRHAI